MIANDWLVPARHVPGWVVLPTKQIVWFAAVLSSAWQPAVARTTASRLCAPSAEPRVLPWTTCYIAQFGITGGHLYNIIQ